MDGVCAVNGCSNERRRTCTECRLGYCTDHDSDMLVDRYHHDRRGKWCWDCVKLEYERLENLLRNK